MHKKTLLTFLFFLIVSLEITTAPNNISIDNINKEKLEKLYTQYGESINPITSDNPTRDIALLNEHIKTLEHEKNQLEDLICRIKNNKVAASFACFLSGIATIADLALINCLLISKDDTETKLLFGIPLSLLALLLGHTYKKLHYYPHQIEQLTKDIEKLINNIITDKIIVAELEKIK